MCDDGPPRPAAMDDAVLAAGDGAGLGWAGFPFGRYGPSLGSGPRLASEGGMRRRDALAGAGLVAAWGGAAAAGLGWSGPLAAQPVLGPPEPFSWEGLIDQARTLATQPYRHPGDERPPQIAALTWDQHNAIRYRRDKSLWVGTDLPFQVQFFHLGVFYDKAVRIFEIADGQARPIAYDPALFDFGPTRLDPPPPPDLGFAGWRMHFHTNFEQDVAVFLGASYFRATDRGDHYGMSCRGLAVGTGLPEPEEFPLFSRFWLVRPRPSDIALTAYALLESESVTGAYRFGIAPGGLTTMDVTAHLFPKRPIERLGIAPLTSMYWFGENDRRATDDWRTEVHDSDGLSLWRGNGEWVWRPLTNPPTTLVSSFLDESPRGFGLLQRDRAFAHYQDKDAEYERRPSVWVEPLQDWGKGAVRLLEIPTAGETFDNVAAFWHPEAPVRPGEELALSYRLYWCQEPPVQPSVARCTATRTGRGGVIGHELDTMRKFVVDFQGGDLPLIPADAPVEAVVSASRGQVVTLTVLDGRVKISPSIRPVPEIDGWRVTFDLAYDGADPIDLRLFLRLGPTTLTETWLYLWTPPR